MEAGTGFPDKRIGDVTRPPASFNRGGDRHRASVVLVSRLQHHRLAGRQYDRSNLGLVAAFKQRRRTASHGEHQDARVRPLDPCPDADVINRWLRVKRSARRDAGPQPAGGIWDGDRFD